MSRIFELVSRTPEMARILKTSEDFFVLDTVVIDSAEAVDRGETPEIPWQQGALAIRDIERDVDLKVYQVDAALRLVRPGDENAAERHVLFCPGIMISDLSMTYPAFMADKMIDANQLDRRNLDSTMKLFSAAHRLRAREELLGTVMTLSACFEAGVPGSYEAFQITGRVRGYDRVVEFDGAGRGQDFIDAVDWAKRSGVDLVIGQSVHDLAVLEGCGIALDRDWSLTYDFSEKTPAPEPA